MGTWTGLTLDIDIAFGYDPYDTSPIWTAVESDVRTFTISRGASNAQDRVSAGSLTMELDNRSGAYDPTYTSGANYPNVKPMTPVRIIATYAATPYTLFYGFINSWPLDWTLGGDATTTVDAFDGLFLLNQMTSATAQVQEATGARIGNLLDDAGWPASWRSLATGQETAAAFTPDCGKVLALIRQVVDTEGGQLAIHGDGSVVFRDRYYRDGLASSHTFGDSGSEVRYQGIRMSYDDSQIWNRVEVQRVDGAAVASEDATSIGDYGERELQGFDTLHTSDVIATDYSAELRDALKDPQVVLDELQFRPDNSNDGPYWAEALGLELAEKVTVNRRPPAGNTISIDVFVEGLTHSVDLVSGEWVTSFNGSQFSIPSPPP